MEYSIGWELGERERKTIQRVPGDAWQQPVMDTTGSPCDVDDAGVIGVTGLLRHSVGDDQLAGLR